LGSGSGALAAGALAVAQGSVVVREFDVLWCGTSAGCGVGFDAGR
jgi:hypothetical protein